MDGLLFFLFLFFFFLFIFAYLLSSVEEGHRERKILEKTRRAREQREREIAEAMKEEILDTIEEAMLESKGWKIVENPKTGKFVVMRDTGKEGFGRWKIAKQFDSEEEAKSFVSKEEE